MTGSSLAPSIALCALCAAVACSRPDVDEVAKVSTSAEPAGSTRVVRVDPSLVTAGRVVIGKVEQRSAQDELRATGTVEADLDGAADVGALVRATVTRILVREGDVVAKGQTLAHLNAPDAARVAGELNKARSQRALAQQTLKRERKLIAEQATTAQELEQAEAALKGVKAAERAARLLLSAYGARGASIQVRAPIAGVVSHRGVDLGALTETGERLFRIVDTDKLLVRAEVLERDAHRVANGDSVRLLFPGGKTCDGTVVTVGAEVEPERHAVSVRIQPKACRPMIAGQTLDVRLFPKSKSKIRQLALPRDAVVELDGVPVVFVAGAKPGEFELVPVTVERLTATSAFLSGGVRAADSVAVGGTILLKGEWMRSSME